MGTEAIVGILMERSLGLLTAIIGIYKAGGAYLPLDRRNPEERTRWMLQECGARLLLTHGAAAGRLPEGCQEVDLSAEQAEIERRSVGNPERLGETGTSPM